jgi:hypothetical protein
MNYYISKEDGTVYWMGRGELLYAPIYIDGTFNTEEAGTVSDAIDLPEQVIQMFPTAKLDRAL